MSFKRSNKRLLIIAGIMIFLGVGGLGFGIYQAHSSQADVADATPNFTPLLPKHKTIEQLGGWQKLTSPGGDSFYVFVDTVSGVTVNFSQQRLPGKFNGDVTNKMVDLARSYNATNQLKAGDTKVYIGTSAKGPQSVLFTQNGVLVLIKSWATISDSDWISYIKTLE